MNLGTWVRVAMQRHLALVIDYHAFVGQDAAFEDTICEALDGIAACDVHVVVVVPPATRVDLDRDLDASWLHLEDGAEITWGTLRDQVHADTIIALADPDRHPHLFSVPDSDRRDVAIAVRGQAVARGWLSGSLSVREFVRWLITVRTGGFMVRPPRFDVGWA